MIKEIGQDVSEARCTFYLAPTSTCITHSRQCAAHAGNSRRPFGAAAIPRHRRRNSRHPLWLLPFRSIRVLVGHARPVFQRAEGALSRHPPRASRTAAPGGLDRHRGSRSQSRPARRASNQDLYQFLAGPRLARLPPAAGSCRCLPPHAALFTQPKGGRQTQSSGSAPPIPFLVCSAGSCGAASPGQYKKLVLMDACVDYSVTCYLSVLDLCLHGH